MGLPRWMNFCTLSKFGDVPHHNSTTIYGLSLSFPSLAAVRNNPPLKFFLTTSSGRERGSRRIGQRRRRNFRSNCNRQRDPPPPPRLRRRRRRRAVIPHCERRERKYVASSAAAAPSFHPLVQSCVCPHCCPYTWSLQRRWIQNRSIFQLRCLQEVCWS